MTTDAVPGVADPAEGLAVPEPSAPNIVTLPDGNSVTLHPEITMAIGIAALAVARRGSVQAFVGDRLTGTGENVESAIVEAGLAEVYLRLGIIAWSFKDAKGQPEPLTPANIARLLPYNGGGREVAEVADQLYSDEVFHPLAATPSGSSRNGRTGTSTPHTLPTGSKHPTRSGRSSRKNSGAGRKSGVRAR